MKTARLLGNGSLLVLLSSAIAAACGDGGTVLQTTDAGGDSSLDATADSRTEAGKDASFADALAEASADADPDACPPGFGPDGDGGCLEGSQLSDFLHSKW